MARCNMLTARNIYKTFGALKVLDGISMQLERGEVLAIIGPSGSGKSTFLRCLTRLELIDRGFISVDGQTMVSDEGGHANYAPSAQLHAIGRKMGMVFQSFNLFPHFSVLRNLTEAPMHVLGRSAADARKHAMELLDKVGLADKCDAYPYQLSGGQQQRVAIARALAMDPEILCFDEPTSALDPELTLEVLDVIRELAREHMTMMVVTHEMAFARDVASRVIFMESGRIIDEGAPEQIFANPQNPRTRQFIGQYRK